MPDGSESLRSSKPLRGLPAASSKIALVPFAHRNFCRTDNKSLLCLTYPDKKRPHKGVFFYRDSQIRTDDILLPKQTLYQTELHPEQAKYSKTNKIEEGLFQHFLPFYGHLKRALISYNRFRTACAWW